MAPSVNAASSTPWHVASGQSVCWVDGIIHCYSSVACLTLSKRVAVVAMFMEHEDAATGLAFCRDPQSYRQVREGVCWGLDCADQSGDVSPCEALEAIVILVHWSPPVHRSRCCSRTHTYANPRALAV